MHIFKKKCSICNTAFFLGVFYTMGVVFSTSVFGNSWAVEGSADANASTILQVDNSSYRAASTVIEFEGASNTVYNAPIVRSGFIIGNVIGDEQHFHEVDSTLYGLPSNGTGVLLNDRDTRIFVEEESTMTFTLERVDVASALNNNPAVGLTVEGFLNDVSTGILQVDVLGDAYTQLDGTSLGTVDRLVFDGFGDRGGFVLDNLAL